MRISKIAVFYFLIKQNNPFVMYHKDLIILEDVDMVLLIYVMSLVLENHERTCVMLLRVPLRK